MNSSQSNKDHYELLKVSRDAPPEIIKAVYRAWMFALKLHPDLGGDGHAAKELNEAYEVLSDEGARAEYDRTLSSIAVKDAEQRRAPRFFVDAEVACLFDDESSWTTARVLDASVMGLRLLQCVSVAKGTRALISFPCAAADAVESKVAWARLKKGSCEFGVEFYEPLHDVLQRLGCKKK